LGVPEVTQETDDELLRRIEAAESTVAVCEQNIKSAKAELLRRREKEIQQLLKAKDEPFGKVEIIVGNHVVDVIVPKKVVWDQGVLAEKRKLITESGDNPDVYVKTKYDVSETAYKSWPQEVRDFFDDARSVATGNPTIKISKKESE
jgi:SAM-dependent MidA family methyltransferase